MPTNLKNKLCPICREPIDPDADNLEPYMDQDRVFKHTNCHNKNCPFCTRMFMEKDKTKEVGDKDHRIFACLECENP